MMLRSGFFNSVNGDRTYNASRFAEYFASFIGNGVFPNPSTNLQAMANNDMTVTVKAGKAWINGYILINDGDYILSIAPADGVLNRIDRIVARFDVLGREITVEVKQGAFGSVPVAPTLQRDADAFELGLADIYIGNGVVAINQGEVTDLRLDSELCGIVHGVVDQVDVTTLYNQYTQGFELKRDEFEQEFMLWFQTLQDVLDENTASNLLNMINANADSIGVVDQKVDAHLADIASQDVGKGADIIGLPDPNNLFTATNIGGAMQELFTNVSNGKNLVGGAITDVDENVVIPTDPTFQELADGIGSISTGKKWASGTATAVFSGGDFVEVRGLSFQPMIVLTKNLTPSYLTENSGFSVYTSLNVFSGTKPPTGIKAMVAAGDSAQSIAGVTIYTDGFRVKTNTNNSTAKTVAWIAIE